MKTALAILLGAGVGYLYYKVVGCSTGACPITSNPYLTTGFGAALGWSILGPSKTATKKRGDQNHAETLST